MLGAREGTRGGFKRAPSIRDLIEDSWKDFAAETHRGSASQEFQPFPLKALDPEFPQEITAKPEIYEPYLMAAARLLMEKDFGDTARKDQKRATRLLKAVVKGVASAAETEKALCALAEESTITPEAESALVSQLQCRIVPAISGFDAMQQQYFLWIAASCPVGNEKAASGRGTQPGATAKRAAESAAKCAAHSHCDWLIRCLEALIRVFKDEFTKIASVAAEVVNCDVAPLVKVVSDGLDQLMVRLEITQVIRCYLERENSGSLRKPPQAAGDASQAIKHVRRLLSCGFVEEAASMGFTLILQEFQGKCFTPCDWSWIDAQLLYHRVHANRSGRRREDSMFDLLCRVMPFCDWGVSLRGIAADGVKAPIFSGTVRDVLARHGIVLSSWNAANAGFLAVGEMSFIPIGGTIGVMHEDRRCLTAVIREKLSSTTLVVRMGKEHRPQWVLAQALEVMYARIRTDWSKKLRDLLKAMRSDAKAYKELVGANDCSASEAVVGFASTLLMRMQQDFPFALLPSEELASEDAFAKVKRLGKLLKPLKDLGENCLQVEVQFFGLGLAGSVFPPEMAVNDQLRALLTIMQSPKHSPAAKSLAEGCYRALHMIVAELDGFCALNPQRVVVTRVCLGGLDAVGLFAENCDSVVEEGQTLPPPVITPQMKGLLHLRVLAIYNGQDALEVRPVVPIATDGSGGIARAMLSKARLICDPDASNIMEVDSRMRGASLPLLLFSTKSATFLRKLSSWGGKRTKGRDIRGYDFEAEGRAFFLEHARDAEADIAALVVADAFAEYQKAWVALIQMLQATVHGLRCTLPIRVWIISEIRTFVDAECPIYVGDGSGKANRVFLPNKMHVPLKKVVSGKPAQYGVTYVARLDSSFLQCWQVCIQDLRDALKANAFLQINTGTQLIFELDLASPVTGAQANVTARKSSAGDPGANGTQQSMEAEVDAQHDHKPSGCDELDALVMTAIDSVSELFSVISQW